MFPFLLYTRALPTRFERALILALLAFPEVFPERNLEFISDRAAFMLIELTFLAI
jgi:hypothetical protein